MMTTPVRFHLRSLLNASITCLLVLCLSDCAVGPNYQRAAVAVPPGYRGITQPPAAQADASSVGDEQWWNVFQDKTLQDLIRTALAQNYDLRIAASRVLQSQAQLGIARADQFPSVSAGGNITSQRSPSIGPIPSYQTTLGQVTAAASWIPDFWGKYRRAAEAARAQLLASQWAQRAVTATLVANVASAYFQIRALDLQLEISQRTLASRKESLQLTRTLVDHGFDTQSDLRQAEELVYTAAAQVPDLERQIEQQENSLSILLGNNPGAIPRGLKLTEQPHPPEVPAGLPSALLARRPDIQEAEENLIAANARIGVARAAYFPQISLTGSAGYESSALESLFTGPATLWSIGGTLTQPIFQGGRLKSNVRLAEAQHEEALLVYRQTIQDAFRDVSNALVAYRKYREFRLQQEHLTEAAQDAARLSEIRFQAGTVGYLEVLTNQTNYFSDQLTLAQAQLNELQALVQLYQVLGGGWR
jgi:multidrug efflux system outer membrane protein